MKIKKLRHLKIYKWFIVLLCFSLLFFCGTYFLWETSFDKKAVWFSYIDLAKMSYDSQEEFQKDFSEALDNVSFYDINTVMVQVRAFSDALYDSQLFPHASSITGHKSLSFDPLKIMIDTAHQKHIKIEAWVNPYRISLNQKTYKQFNQSIHKNWIHDTTHVLQYGTYKYMLNPASQDARDYIVSGIKEIIDHYHVDGIVFDDYFYVDGTQQYATQKQRLDYVNMLIQDVYRTIKETDSHLTFGISPQGNYENCINQGADVDLWLKEEGYIDYLMPQIYWSDAYGEKNEKMFTTRSKYFAHLDRNLHVSLYASLALYRSGQKMDIDKGWSQSTHNIKDQIHILKKYHYQGYSLFSYSSLLNKEGQKK